MIRPSVRPMRSNEDLLSALKKRRLNEKNKPQGEKAFIDIYFRHDWPKPFQITKKNI